MFPLAVPQMFSSKHVVLKNQGTLCFVPVLHDPCKAAITKSKEINPPLFFTSFSICSQWVHYLAHKLVILAVKSCWNYFCGAQSTVNAFRFYVLEWGKYSLKLMGIYPKTLPGSGCKWLPTIFVILFHFHFHFAKYFWKVTLTRNFIA